jgi:RNA polymerase sigma-70 factor (ECF subfamily)
MTRNKSIDRLRSLQRRYRLHDDVQNENASNDISASREPFEDLDSSEKGRILRTAVMKLSKEQREAIEMAYFSGLTQQEIAAKLREPLGTVKARIRRGMMRLKKIIGSTV